MTCGESEAREKQDGFTLLGVEAAIIVIAIALVGLMIILLTMTRLNAITREKNTALTQAKYWMEELKAHSFGDIYSRYGLISNFDVVFYGATGDDGSTTEGRIVLILEENPTNEELLAMCGLPADSPRDMIAFFGFPRDLNLDGDTNDPEAILTSSDPDEKYKLLPVYIAVDWRSSGADQHIELSCILTERKPR